MKKILLILLVVLGVGVSGVCLLSCSKVKSDQPVYYGIKDNIEYKISIDEKNSSFVMELGDKSKTTYLGSYTFKNGYYILQSTLYGTEYIKISGDSFEFFSPNSPVIGELTPSPVSCKHEYYKKTSVDGNCTSRGYVLSVCSKCGAEKKETTTYGNHSYQFVKEVVKGTCTTKAKSEYACKYCNKYMTVESTEYADHKFGDPILVSNNCKVKAQSVLICSVCKTEKKTSLSYYGDHKYKDGVCTTCFSRENDIIFDADHPDANKNGICDNCYTPLKVLDDMRKKGYSLAENGYLYFGMYPQQVSKYSAEKIKENGVYNEKTGRYVYMSETYVIATPAINNLPKFKGGNAEEPQKGKEYAFVVSPIKWRILSNDDGVYNLVCTTVLDSTYYLHDLNYVFDSAAGKYVLKRDNTVNANNYINSDIKKSLSNLQNEIFSAADGKYLKYMVLPESTTIFNYDNFPAYSDYAIAKSTNLSFTKIFSSVLPDEPENGTKTNVFNAIMVANTNNSDGPDVVIDSSIVFSETFINEKVGIAPVIKFVSE